MNDSVIRMPSPEISDYDNLVAINRNFQALTCGKANRSIGVYKAAGGVY